MMPTRRSCSSTGSCGMGTRWPCRRHTGGEPARRWRSLPCFSTMGRSQRSISGIVVLLFIFLFVGLALWSCTAQGLQELHLILHMKNGFIRRDDALVNQLRQADVHHAHALL